MAYDDAMNYDGLESWDEPSSAVSPKWPNIGQSASRLGSNASSQGLMGMFRNLQGLGGGDDDPLAQFRSRLEQPSYDPRSSYMPPMAGGGATMPGGNYLGRPQPLSSSEFGGEEEMGGLGGLGLGGLLQYLQRGQSGTLGGY